MKLKIETNKRELRVTIPESWTDRSFTVRAYQRMVAEYEDGEELIKLFSALTGVPVAGIASLDNQEVEEELILKTAFIRTERAPFLDAPVPEKIRINGKDIILPKNLGRLTFGQSLAVKRRIMKHKKYEELIAYATAVYLQPLIDGTDGFDDGRAEQLEHQILELPIADIYPVGFFLLRRQMPSGWTIMRELNRMILKSVAAALSLPSRRKSINLNLTKTSK